jgi:hypothetical protein
MRFFSNFGPSRRRDAAMRHHFRRCQPRLRSLFIMRIESFKYRRRVSGYELPEAGRTAQRMPMMIASPQCWEPFAYSSCRVSAGRGAEPTHEFAR